MFEAKLNFTLALTKVLMDMEGHRRITRLCCRKSWPKLSVPTAVVVDNHHLNAFRKTWTRSDFTVDAVRGLHAQCLGLDPATVVWREDVPASWLKRTLADFLLWLDAEEARALPTPIQAAIVAEVWARLRPFAQQQPKVGHLLASLLLRERDYDLGGCWSLSLLCDQKPEVFETVTSQARPDLGKDLQVPVERFCTEMAQSQESLCEQMITGWPSMSSLAASGKQVVASLEALPARQQTAIQYFRKKKLLSSKRVGRMLGLGPRGARYQCSHWVGEGFLVAINPAKRPVYYKLAKDYHHLL